MDLSTLYQHYKDPLIARIAKLVRCRESAWDIVQESFLVLMQRLAGQSITNPRAYLDRTATHLAFDHLKHRRVIARHRQEASAFPETCAPSAEQLASAEARIGRFDEALGELPRPYRDVFILLRLRGMSYLEAAAALNLSERQVERYLLHALMHCRQALEDR